MTGPAGPAGLAGLAGLDAAALAAAVADALTGAGVAVPVGRATSFAAALGLSPPTTRSQLYWTARVTLVGDVGDIPTFDGVFRHLFGPPTVDGDPAEFRQAGSSTVGEPGTAPPPMVGRAPDVARTWAPPALVARHLAERSGNRDPAGEDGSQPATLAAVSADELLRHRDLAGFSDEELARLRTLVERLTAEPPQRPGRRTRRSTRGPRVDLRATLRTSVRTAGDPVVLVHRRYRPALRRLVLLCDVSGSMEAYARAYLLLLGSAVAGARAEAFVLATRLTRVTRALRARRGGAVPTAVAELAADWGSGTRLGAGLRAFVAGPGRRGLARGAVVVVLSDGWEPDDPALLGEQVARLSRLAHRLIWVNPRRAAAGYQPLAAGMAAALPYVDRFVSGHSPAALEEVLAAIRADD